MIRAHLSRFLPLGTLLIIGGLAGASRATHTYAATHAFALTAAPLRSTGCGRAATGGTDISGVLSVGGLQRTYLLHVPTSYTSTTPLPLILNLHGAGMTMTQQAGLTHMSTTADSKGFLVAYPQATQASPSWNTGLTGNAAAGVDDVGFLTALVSQLKSQYCVDTTRIAATGISDGAVMTYHLACSNVPWLAAIAPVAGTIPSLQSSCTLAHPLPLLAVHGQLDWVVPYGGMPWAWVPSIPQVIANWAMAQGCAAVPQTPTAQGDMAPTVYTGCRADTQLDTIIDGGHTWPGGFPMPWLGTTSTAIDASALIFSFFAAHPLQ